jgi:hypothetical protein
MDTLATLPILNTGNSNMQSHLRVEFLFILLSKKLPVDRLRYPGKSGVR